MHPIRAQRIEGVFLFLLAVWAFQSLNMSWWIFLIFILLPDISMFAYYRGAEFGAWVYNWAHMYTLPIVIGGFSFGYNFRFLLALCIIWFAHIALDRALGYGLKIATGFRDTHLGRIKTRH